jgi:hypothetical protein
MVISNTYRCSTSSILRQLSGLTAISANTPKINFVSKLLSPGLTSSIMSTKFLIYLLTILLSNSSSTTAAPTSLSEAAEPYNCGYVLTLHNSSAYAGLSAYDRCKGIHYDQDTHEYIPAFAYDLFGGCKCKFYQ